MSVPAAAEPYTQAGDPGVSEETRRAEREHFESVCRAFLYYREHGLQIIKKAEVCSWLQSGMSFPVFMNIEMVSSSCPAWRVASNCRAPAYAY